MTTLRDLEARLMRRIDERTSQEVHRVDEADGIYFLCPKCFEANGGARGTHSIGCWTPNVPPETLPGPGRWLLAGTSIDDLTLAPVPGHTASVDLTKNEHGCKAHFFVENGVIRHC